MSWDISVCKFSRDYDLMEDIPNDERCFSIGLASDVRAKISEVFIGTNWSDPTWGTFDSPFGSVEFNMASNESVLEGFMMHVRAGEELVPPVIELVKKNAWQALDCSSGEFLEKSIVPEDGLRKWLAFRDKVI